MTRFLAFCVFWLSALMVSAAADAPVVQDFGVCRFVLHHYDLPQKDQATINMIIGDLLKEHEKAFDFIGNRNQRIQIRIFGREEDYNAFGRTNHVSVEKQPSASLSSNVAGYYSVRDHEVVTWRQHTPSYLANNILHECSHAITHQQFQRLPIWLNEGTAVYFEFPRYMRDENDERQLRAKWVRIKKFMDEGTLPALRDFLNITPREFREQSSTRVYTVSWSLVQLLMSTPENRRAMNEMLRKYQGVSNPQPHCATLLDSTYPGGLTKMDRDWRDWIARGAANVLGTKAK